MNYNPQTVTIKKFIDDDAGYLKWLKNHPEGYVINVPRSRRKGRKILLHRPSCYCVSSPHIARTWTTGQNMKICCREKLALCEWISANLDVPISLCSKCNTGEAFVPVEMIFNGC